MIYLDHAAATPVSPKALSAMLPYFSEQFFNPSAPYLPAKHVREAYENAKNQIAHTVGAKGADLVITSGATESINLAFTVLDAAANSIPFAKTQAGEKTESGKAPQASESAQVARKSQASEKVQSDEKAYFDAERGAHAGAKNQFGEKVQINERTCFDSERGKHPGAKDQLREEAYFGKKKSSPARRRPKVLVLATEHVAVLEAAKKYQYDIISVDKNGLIDFKDLRRKIDDTVALISVSLANNELGTIQPLADIAEIIKNTRQERLGRGVMTPLYLHSDASQALNLLDVSVARMGVDLLTLNAAKCGGPKGVGALYIGHGVQLRAINLGGGQERGLRSGTENVPGVMGFAAAATEAKTHLYHNRKKYQEMNRVLRQSLHDLEQYLRPKKIADPETSKHGAVEPKMLFLGQERHQLASFCPVCFVGLDAERLVYILETEKILISTGAACAANKGTKSHVLTAIGLSDAEIAGSLRISLGATNTLDDVKRAGAAIFMAALSEYTRLGLTQNVNYCRYLDEKTKRLVSNDFSDTDAKKPRSDTGQTRKTKEL